MCRFSLIFQILLWSLQSIRLLPIPMSSSSSSSSDSGSSSVRDNHPFHRIPRSGPGVAPTSQEVASFLGATAILRPETMQAPMIANLSGDASHRIKTKIQTVRHPFGGDTVNCYASLAIRGLSFEYVMGFDAFYFYKSPLDGFHVVFHRALPDDRMEMVDYAFSLELETPARRVRGAKASVQDVMNMGEAYKRAFGPMRYVAWVSVNLSFHLVWALSS